MSHLNLHKTFELMCLGNMYLKQKAIIILLDDLKTKLSLTVLNLSRFYSSFPFQSVDIPSHIGNITFNSSFQSWLFFHSYFAFFFTPTSFATRRVAAIACLFVCLFEFHYLFQCLITPFSFLVTSQVSLICFFER